MRRRFFKVNWTHLVFLGTTYVLRIYQYTLTPTVVRVVVLCLSLSESLAPPSPLLNTERTNPFRRFDSHSTVDVLTRDSSITLAPGGQLTAVEPSGPFLSVSKEGQWKLDATERFIKLDYAR